MAYWEHPLCESHSLQSRSLIRVVIRSRISSDFQFSACEFAHIWTKNECHIADALVSFCASRPHLKYIAPIGWTHFAYLMIVTFVIPILNA